MFIGRNLIRNKDNGKKWITNSFPEIQPGGKNFSIDVTVLLRNGRRTKGFYDYREAQWKSAFDYVSIIQNSLVKGWKE